MSEKINKRNKRTKWKKSQLDILYECWKGADSNKDRIKLVEEKLSSIPPLVALNKMRVMANSDPKWISMSTRKKNQKERELKKVELEKEKKKKERERRREEVLQRKLLREEKKKEREKMKIKKSIKNEIKDGLKISDFENIKQLVENKMFFCNRVQQFMSNIVCIFRVHSKDYGFSIGGPCEKCNKMDEYIPKIQEVLDNARQERIERNKASKGGGKGKKKFESGSGEHLHKKKEREASNSTKCEK